MPDSNRYLKNIIPQSVDIAAYKELKEIKDHIYDFVKRGDNLYICSDKIQNGKTTWSIKLLYKYFNEIWLGNAFVPRGYFVYVPEFLANMASYDYKNTKEFKELDNIIKTVDLVVWDDITTMNLAENAQNILNTYLNKRYMDGKANIYNGLYQGEYLESVVGKLLSMRLKKSHNINLWGDPATEREEF